MQKLKLNAGRVLATLGGAVATVPVYAQDYSTLTGAVDWTEVGTAILAIGAAIVGVFVVFKGVKLVVNAVRGV